MDSAEIRNIFLDFFKERKHKVFPSDNLIPSGDPSLLFTSAGMVQFKPYFLGEVESSSPRAVSCQKCLRTTDIERVGKTGRHHTFFEMLGNFSFGDYFKEKAIEWSWEFLTEHLKIPQESLWVSIYNKDEESAKIWEEKIGLSKERIVRLGQQENFWAMGDTGPCGPCSEILLDRGKDKGCQKTECGVRCDCGRFLEIWNLVFTQYNRRADGSLIPLPKKNIDTGMGLERLAAVLQGKDSNFETDLIKPIIKEIEELTEFNYQKDQIKAVSFRIIADHIRAVTFLNSEGIYFSNIGRGYVGRRLLRRAASHGRFLGIKGDFLYRLVGTIGEIYKSVYPQIKQFREELSRRILQEEKRFNETLNTALIELKEAIKRIKSKGEKLISGEIVFKLYDSFGFPVEMTEEAARREGLKIDRAGFETLMEKHKESARGSWKEEKNPPARIIVKGLSPTEFTGYEKLEVYSLIKALFRNGQRCQEAKAGEEIALMLDKTCFYAESGGQISDAGFITGEKSEIEISRVLKNAEKQIIHLGKVNKGIIKLNHSLKAKVNILRRSEITHSHTATHLLQAALRTLIDKNIRQAGSWVGRDEFRFDFSYYKKLSLEEITAIEEWVNERIEENISLKTALKDRDEAVKSGAISLFGEKYSQKVRVVSISDYSCELCGGTHVKSTGQIGIFKIINEASVASGIRRIEAVTGKNALKKLREESRILKETAKILHTSLLEVPKTVERLLTNFKNSEKRKKRKNDSWSDINQLLKQAERIGNIKVLRKIFKGLSRPEMLVLIDKIRNCSFSGIVILLSRHPDKIELVTSVSPDLVKQGYKADEIANEISKTLGGSGGGRPDLGRGGGQDFSGIDKALQKIERIFLK